MKRYKQSFFISLVILLLSNVFWIYVVIDNGLTYTYQQVTLNEKENSVKLLGELIVKNGQKYTKKDILYILHQEHMNAFIIEEDNLINIEGVKFIFINDRLAKIEA